jgi:predicted TIM-barrel fold metal-dependent hydrolase
VAAAPDRQAAGEMRVIAIEEHFRIPALKGVGMTARPQQAPSDRPELLEKLGLRLDDIGDDRIADMDAAGIDLQVLGHAVSVIEQLAPEVGVPLAREANEFLAAAVQAHPDRFAGFATLPVSDPDAAATELDRCVRSYGFVGAMLCGHGLDCYLDDRRAWPIFERAQSLDVPIYLHPAGPHADVVRAYYTDYESTGIQGAPWGWGVEAGTQAIRLILSGLFDVFPGLRIVLGHLGETIPYAVRRLDRARTPLERKPSEYFCEHFYITTSGNFHYPAMLCAMMTMGPDHVLFAIDYPYVENKAGVDFLRSVPISDSERELIAHGNAERLLKLV